MELALGFWDSLLWYLKMAGKQEVLFCTEAYFHYFLISYEAGVRTCFESTACLFFHGEHYNFWSMFDSMMNWKEDFS